MSEPSLYRRIVRRETHQSRSSASVIVLALVTLGALYVGIELVLALLGDSPLLVSPAAAAEAFRGDASWLPIAGACAIVFGLILLIVALVPSRRARHGVSHDRMAIVIDDGVLAGALAGDARRSVAIGADRVRASVGRRTASIRLVPTSGVPISRDVAQESADRLLGTLNTFPKVRASVTVSESGVVGS
jgi:hypothetical protein